MNQLLQIIEKHPALIAHMCWVACLSYTEAAACIRDYRAGHTFSGEAVNHYGGTRAVIERAWKHRRLSRDVLVYH